MRRLAKEDDPMINTMKLLIDGIAYTVKLKDNSAIKAFALQSPIELTLKRYADQEYYAPLPKPLPISGMPTTTSIHAGELYCYAGFGVLSIPFEDAPLHPYEDIISHLALAGNTVSAKIEIIVT